ncbi:30S ribosomal protein S3 [Mycoplasmopsis californica HAZ160_1]|uniref:Small ribosomal subunit protein uS3 n=2 Tax=Mycoplasmopsis californica TaxID=2113 RepID=A0A059XS22_9BACT|nr:30S ribosomal protein S3 [Mycoplasmopsis californica]AIA29613.1 30S ribosomal protein S3 [Mycoplasmopsis californica]BAP00950.1 30S ribosomal protein S3 [Mycoplasmopsis californica HAZ160_1]BBG40814.1 30S ribosomal protein S3 [Mycoplasmopsis californica]BBG41408.1 30S ribosomal protein S3 [Mycoplasmopsis californica]BBG42001.1 30S ribosomal protein S3 [Mycoplasmopsis californica]
MGQKVNPNGFRYGITKPLNTTWFADKKDFGTQLVQDDKIYKFFDKLVRKYQIGQVEIKRVQSGKITVYLHVVHPAKILGEGGSNIQALNLQLHKYLKDKKADINLQVVQIAKPELNARLAAEAIAIRLENRESFRIAQKYIINDALKAHAKGIKTAVSGRLNGVDMARTEGYSRGEMKLHTLRQDVDYAQATARTTYGAIGVKVWISKGEFLEGGKK